MASTIYTDRITSVATLRSAIRVLEVEQTAKELELKEKLHLAYENLRPVNIIRRTVRDLISSSVDTDSGLSGTAVGAAGGYLLKKIIVGSSGGLIRKLIGSALQIGMTNLAAHKSGSIKSFFLTQIQHLLQRRERRRDTGVS
jgi:hypothetical protein